jgi:endoglycosylceramidase
MYLRPGIVRGQGIERAKLSFGATSEELSSMTRNQSSAKTRAAGSPKPRGRHGSRGRLATRILVCAAAAGILLGAASTCSPKPTYITDEQGRALILHGLNVSSDTKWDPQRMPWVRRADVERMALDWGLNFARFLVEWDGLEMVQGVYDEVYLDRIAERLDWFADAGIYVVLDMHQDLYGPEDSDGRVFRGNGHPPWSMQTDGEPYEPDPNHWFLDYLTPAITRAFDNFWDHDGHPELQDHHVAAWAHIAERFRDHPAVLGYDIMNEPWPGSLVSDPDPAAFDTGPYREFLERAIAAIRAVDPDGWIFFEPHPYGPSFGLPSYIPVLDDPRPGENRLAYFPHYYSILVDIFGYYDPESDDSIEEWRVNRRAESLAQRAPLLIGEWGTWAEVVKVEQYLKEVARMADGATSGWAYWSYDLGGGWSPIDANRNETLQADIIVRAYPQRIAGTPRIIDYDPESRVFRLVFSEKAGVSGPTEIYIPKSRFYPEGFDLEVSDPPGSWQATWDPDREILSFHANPGSPRHEVVVRPSS